MGTAYGIPITSPPAATRKPIPWLAPVRHVKRASLPRTPSGATCMMDILMLAIAAALFAVGIGYAYACERL
jgi:hypothetical protein